MCFKTTQHSLVIINADICLLFIFESTAEGHIWFLLPLLQDASLLCLHRHVHKILGKTYNLVLHISDINRWQMEAVIAGEIINNSVKYPRNQT